MRLHYRQRRRLGLKITDDNNLPLCLSRWHKFLQEQARARAAALVAARGGMHAQHRKGSLMDYAAVSR
jgi:hypothetical protein